MGSQDMMQLREDKNRSFRLSNLKILSVIEVQEFFREQC